MHWSKHFFILSSTSPKEFTHWMILFHIIGVTKLLVVGEPRWVREPAIGTAPRAQLLQVAPNKIISYQSLERQRHRCETFLGTSCIIFLGLGGGPRRQDEDGNSCRRIRSKKKKYAATLDARHSSPPLLLLLLLLLLRCYAPRRRSRRREETYQGDERSQN